MMAELPFHKMEALHGVRKTINPQRSSTTWLRTRISTTRYSARSRTAAVWPFEAAVIPVPFLIVTGTLLVAENPGSIGLTLAIQRLSMAAIITVTLRVTTGIRERYRTSPPGLARARIPQQNSSTGFNGLRRC